MKQLINQARKQHPNYVKIISHDKIELPNGERYIYTGDATRMFLRLDENGWIKYDKNDNDRYRNVPHAVLADTDEHSFSLMDGKTLTEKIKSNPYLKISNCTDIADIEAAMDDLRKLDAEYGEDNKTLLKLWNKFLEKKKKLEKENN